jgi:Multicopper oxidase
MRSSTLSSLLFGSLIPAAALASTVVHDDSFTPDHILRATVLQVPSGCESRQSVVVNGTSPGPAIHLLPGTSSWIRVYNDMTDQNLTMVSYRSARIAKRHRSSANPVTALAWLDTTIGAIRRWNPPSCAMAHTSRTFLRLRGCSRNG